MVAVAHVGGVIGNILVRPNKSFYQTKVLCYKSEGVFFQDWGGFLEKFFLTIRTVMRAEKVYIFFKFSDEYWAGGRCASWT